MRTEPLVAGPGLEPAHERRHADAAQAPPTKPRRRQEATRQAAKSGGRQERHAGQEGTPKAATAKKPPSPRAAPKT